MAETDVFRSVFVPGLYAHNKAWKRVVRTWAESADEVIQLGDFINTNITLNDLSEVRKANSRFIKYMELWRATDDRWTTLLGPNELITLNSPDKWVTAKAHQALRDGWFGTYPIFKVAAVSKGRLVTPGGLTHGEWLKIGAPDTADEAAARLNEKYVGKLFLGESWRIGGQLNFDANPVFAHPISETYNSWITSSDLMPFGQIHGLENLKISPNHMLAMDDFNLGDKVKYKQIYKWGSALITNGNFFIGANSGIHDVLGALDLGKVVLYSEVTRIGEG